MKKLAFTVGDFDCINQNHLHLINEMRKIVIPDNEVVVVLVDDYASFVNSKRFPIQDYDRRQNNLSFFVKNIVKSIGQDPTGYFKEIIEQAKKNGYQPIFVGYDDNKDFKGREFLSENNISIRFIKKQNG
jgi:glycerol-3-phosphate cytidylyltransferase-like family protein